MRPKWSVTILSEQGVEAVEESRSKVGTCATNQGVEGQGVEALDDISDDDDLKIVGIANQTGYVKQGK